MIDYKVSPGTAGNSEIPERYDDLPSHNIEVFQSENIQNILDAKSSNKSLVEIDYEIVKLSNEEIKNLEKLLGKEYFKMLITSFEKCKAQDIEDQVERVRLAFKNKDMWHALIITEKNTTGLIGAETGIEEGSKYDALIRSTNRSEKSTIGGGTFGKGSSVYTYSSGLWLWFAYSILEAPWQGTRARFVGRGMIAPFVDYQAKQSYMGPLWYAKPEDKRKETEQGLPFINNEAHEQASLFGLKKRAEKDFGTTYLIPVFWPDGLSATDISSDALARDLRHEIVKRWFVPIHNEKLKCTIRIRGTEESIEISKAELSGIPELKFKLEILDWYDSGASKADRRFKIDQVEVKLPILKKPQQEKNFKKFGKRIGQKQLKVKMDLVVRVLNDEERKFQGFKDDDDVGTVNRVALIRNLGMVVNHYPYDSKSKSDLKAIVGENNFEAIFFGGKMTKGIQQDEIDHLEMFLGFSENPAHNEWIHNLQDINRCHLKRFEDNPQPKPVNRVNALFVRIYTLMAEFFPKEEQSQVKKEICSFWRKLYKLPSTGEGRKGVMLYRYETLNEGFDSEGRYTWDLRMTSVTPEAKVKLQFSHYLSTHEGPIRKQEEFKELGIPEFGELLIYENGERIEEIVLEYDGENNKGIPKRVEVKTCKITLNNTFKNISPILEINDHKDGN